MVKYVYLGIFRLYIVMILVITRILTHWSNVEQNIKRETCFGASVHRGRSFDELRNVPVRRFVPKTEGMLRHYISATRWFFPREDGDRYNR